MQLISGCSGAGFFARQRVLVLGLLALALLSGCTSNPTSKRDPLEPMNRGIYQFNDNVDRAVIKPVATGYRKLPDPVRTGVGNFFGNLGDVLIIANDLLQFKMSQAASDATRLVVNTTVGLCGIFDVATKWGFPKHDNDFGQTLGKWGVPSGPFLMLPILGPSTFRDTVGLAVDGHYNLVYNYTPVSDRNVAIAVNGVHQRSEFLDASKILDEASLDPYMFLRDAYLQRRDAKIRDGKPRPISMDDETD
jgi:phospholipid-binding lipoprotein MlaA